jgi:DNA-binding GntR family transcriptional regulator
VSSTTKRLSVERQPDGERAAARRSAAVPSPAMRMSDIAYERILEGLFARRVPAGGFVSQKELSAIVDVPIAPLRDALRTLETEGILTIHPRSGIQFVRPGLELTRSTYQFRSIIERQAVRTFAEQGDEALMSGLEVRHSRLVRRIERDGLDEEVLAELDRLEHELHNAIVGELHNPLIDTMYRRMHNYLRLLRLDRKMTAPIALRTLKEHLDILEACATRSADAAEKALALHFQAAVQRNLGLS